MRRRSPLPVRCLWQSLLECHETESMAEGWYDWLFSGELQREIAAGITREEDLEQVSWGLGDTGHKITCSLAQP